MIISSITHQLMTAPEFAQVSRDLSSGEDVVLSLGQSARPLVVASLWAQNPRSTLLCVSGEEAALRAVRALSCWLGNEVVRHYPERKDLPWSEKPRDLDCIARRCEAMALLAEAKPCIVVASARALLKQVPPKKSRYWEALELELGSVIEPRDLVAQLIEMGYCASNSLEAPGFVRHVGDVVDVWPAQSSAAVRCEFFGDEVERLRRLLPATGQTIAELEQAKFSPCREYVLNKKTIVEAKRSLYDAAQDESEIAADLELIAASAEAPHLEKYLPELYGTTVSPLTHLADSCLVVLAEPRSLFDDCLRAYDDLVARSQNDRIHPDRFQQLYTEPRAMDFGKQQRLSLSSLMRSGAAVATELQTNQPSIAGSDTKFLTRVHQLLADQVAIAFAVPERSAREHLQNVFIDEHISFDEQLGSLAEGSSPLLEPGRVTFFDAPVPAGIVIPSAHLAVFSIADLAARSSVKKSSKRIDPTSITFPFKPGDYVVHAVHGIALFSKITRREIDGRERDFFELSYAEGDKLFIPLERVDRLTRYIGPDGQNPRLTRLNSADWTRATTKAKASAKKLAFDLVDLYTRRASTSGFIFMPDTPAQEDMEASFAWELTEDQARSLADIKLDMESSRPMDRLLCGDVGFGKTEVALRAAFKCVDNKRQVMLLCPTTILAEQHYQTFYERFVPFGLSVAVLSRFVTPAKQRKILEGFAKGEVDVLIGTHRLLSNDVSPAQLGLVIIDEEQRFGVQHKEQLKTLREQVDVLTLSATPIPRTMQMAMSGVRDMSLILTPPPGRLPVKVHVGEFDPDVVSAALREEMARGGQIYYVSNRVKSLDEALERVREAAPEARVGIAHGKMSAREVENVMLEFAEHEIDVLLATTIIESGIDSARTNTLIIEDSHRLGLAQLYQLKGRVGRGKRQAYAYFMFPADQPLTDEATERLCAIGEHTELGSGMRIAMRDLEIRGAGSLMGAEQHGNLSSVGFDLFTQMLSDAVGEARGEVVGENIQEVTLNLPADYYLDEEYLPDISERVLIYRKIACAVDIADIDQLEQSLVRDYGQLPEAGKNLLDRARVRIRAQRLGINSISLSNQRLVFSPLELKKHQVESMKRQGALYYATSHKLGYPFKQASGESPVLHALNLLEQLGGDDE